MDAPQAPRPSDDLNNIINSAKRLGIELDDMEALQWLSAISLAETEDQVTLDTKTGVFGHRVTMLDFNPAELAHFRRIGKLVEFTDVPQQVETALALSGSAAQSKIQAFPGDADYFERVNIKAETREEACRILGQIMKQKVVDTFKGPTYQMIEIKFGNYPREVVRDGRKMAAGSPVSWTPDEVLAGGFDVLESDSSEGRISWDDASADPGWTKLDWVVADPAHNTLVNASNMLDATWEALDGTITPLDGYLDPYFQEVYLEAESIPVFSKLAKHVDSDALSHYVGQLEKEVKKYTTKDVNYGKAAKRMYNIFRLTGRYNEAAYLRELFDEPATILYQVWSLIRTIDDCVRPDSTITKEMMLHQTDELIVNVVKTLEGEKETEIIRLLLRLRDALSNQSPKSELSPPAEAARAEVINIVNNFYFDRLTAIPTIKEYMDHLQE